MIWREREREGDWRSVLSAHTNTRPLITICEESEVITGGPAGIIIVSTQVRIGERTGVRRTYDSGSPQTCWLEREGLTRLIISSYSFGHSLGWS